MVDADIDEMDRFLNGSPPSLRQVP